MQPAEIEANNFDDPARVPGPLLLGFSSRLQVLDLVQWQILDQISKSKSSIKIMNICKTFCDCLDLNKILNDMKVHNISKSNYQGTRWLNESSSEIDDKHFEDNEEIKESNADHNIEMQK